MAKENQSAQPKTQQKPKPAPAKQQAGPAAGVLEVAPDSLGMASAPGVEKQANRLADSRLSLVQRQMMATNLGQMHGNGHMQEVMAFVRQQQVGQQDSPETNSSPTVLQRREAVGDDKPSEVEKAAALASAKAAEQKAAQSSAQGQNQFNKAKAEKETKQQEGETAKQQVVADAAPTEPQAKAGRLGATEKGALPVGESTPEVAIDANADGAVDQATDAGPTAKAPASAAEDPAFQGVVANVKATGAKSASHAPAGSKAGEAQDAAESPASEIEGKAQANQVGEMAQAETPAFDAAAFKAQLMERIAALSPKTAAEADEFKESNKLGGLKDEMQGKVSQERDAARGPLEEKAAAAPDTGAVEPKSVTPLAVANPGAAPADPGAKAAAPKQKGSGEVEQPIRQNAQQVDQQMASAEVTDEQLANSNEPSFQGALAAKTEAKAQAATAPNEYRQFEQGQIAGAEAEAAATAQAKTQAMHGDRAALFTQVDGQQNQAKGKDEQARAQVAAKIQTFYGKTKSNVEKILTGLDAEVSQAFDAGAAAAKQVFEEYVDAKMEAFKEERYGGWFGWAKWAKDKLVGMPSEVNAFYGEGRKRYLQEMDAVIDKVVTTIGSGLTKAKAEIATGKQEIQEYVAGLPQELQEVGQQASQDIQSKFDELESSVDSKQNELIDTLASKYQEKLQAVDARIDELKAANAGLVDKALNAVVGVIQTILKLKNMLMTVLAKVADVVGKIIKDPIGFLGNLISGLKQGFENFGSNILTHLKAGFIGWLTGAIGGAGLQLPDDIFSLEGIFDLVTQVMGITWDYIRGKAVKLLGEPVVNALETAFEPFKILVTEGPMGLWKYVKEQFTDLKAMVMDQIQDLLITQVIKAGIKWILGLMNPAGAFVKAAMAIYDIVMFFVNKGSQMMELVTSIIDSVRDIASGAVGGAAKLIENTLAKALPLAIGFLASLLGIGGLGQKVQGIIQKVRGKIDAVVDKFLLKAKKIGRKLLRKLGIGGKDEDAEGEESNEISNIQVEEAFSMAGEGHHLYIKSDGPLLEIEMASSRRASLQALVISAIREEEKGGNRSEVLGYLNRIWDRLRELQDIWAAGKYYELNTEGGPREDGREVVRKECHIIATFLVELGKDYDIPSLQDLGHPSRYVEGNRLKPEYAKQIRAKFYPSGYKSEVIQWKKQRLAQLTHPADPSKFRDEMTDKYEPKFKPDGKTNVTIDHQTRVVEHWAAEGNNSTQTERSEFYNRLSGMRLVAWKNNSSDGAEARNLGLVYLPNVGPEFRGPHEEME